MSLFFQTLVNGLLVGGLYVTISIGFSLAFGVLDVVDFAVGEWVMLGAFAGVASTSWIHVDPFAALPLVFVVFAGVGALLARLSTGYGRASTRVRRSWRWRSRSASPRSRVAPC